MNDDDDKRYNIPSSGKPINNARAGFGRQQFIPEKGTQTLQVRPPLLKSCEPLTRTQPLPRPQMQPRTQPIHHSYIKTVPIPIQPPVPPIPQPPVPQPSQKTTPPVQKKTLTQKIPKSAPVPPLYAPKKTIEKPQSRPSADIDIERVTKFIKQVEAYTGTKVKII